MNYLELRKKYVLYRYVAIVLAVICILITAWAVRDITIQIICILLVNVVLFLTMLFIKKSYIRAGNKLLHSDLDLISWRQYIEHHKKFNRPIMQMDASLTSVSYSYMTGDFDAAIKEATEALAIMNLKPKYRDFLVSYLIRSTILARPDLNREELDDMLNVLTISDPILADKITNTCYALHDLTIAHKSNDYFEDLKNDFTYQKLEICYYQALNAKIKGQVNKSKELFSKLAQEEQELYIVKKAKEFLYS